MQLLKLLLILLPLVLVNACAFVPKYAAKEPSQEKCDLVTKKLTLDLTNINVNCGRSPSTIIGYL
jgi:hypothetical protein